MTQFNLKAFSPFRPLAQDQVCWSCMPGGD